MMDHKRYSDIQSIYPKNRINTSLEVKRLRAKSQAVHNGINKSQDDCIPQKIIRSVAYTDKFRVIDSHRKSAYVR